MNFFLTSISIHLFFRFCNILWLFFFPHILEGLLILWSHYFIFILKIIIFFFLFLNFHWIYHFHSYFFLFLGLLATEAGTLGRVIGDMAITAFSVTTSSTELINILFSPVAAGVIVCILLSARYFDRMAVWFDYYSICPSVRLTHTVL